MDNVLWLLAFIVIAFAGYLAGASLTVGALVGCLVLFTALGLLIVAKCEHIPVFIAVWYCIWATIFMLIMWVTYALTADMPTTGTFIHTYILR